MHLCEVCSAVAFDELFNYPAREYHDECFAEMLPISQHNYGTLEELQNRSFFCPVCSFLVDAWIRGARRPSQVKSSDQLLMKRWRRTMESPIAWLNVIGVQMTGPLALCVQFGPAGREYDGLVLAFQPPGVTKHGKMTTFRAYTNEELVSGVVDFAMVQEWLKSCNEHHSKCRLQGEEKPDDKRKRRLEEEELRLIDVETREIVRPKRRLPYVTLSYVYIQQGAAPTVVPPPNGNRLPDQLPQTIADALRATKAIGERYLWIDAYCIDQTNADEKQRLIGKMDLVYENAKLAICVLTPADVGAGMYGVSLPIDRFDQVVETTPAGTFLSVEIPRLVKHINKSL